MQISEGNQYETEQHLISIEDFINDKPEQLTNNKNSVSIDKEVSCLQLV